VAATIDRLAAADAVFTVDVGTPCIWTARYVRMNGSRRLIGSFNHGSMANALPQAIGAQAAQPGREVIALSGDGGLAMLLGELLTLRQQHLPVKVVVFNNGALSFVELEMKAAGIVTYATDLDNPAVRKVFYNITITGISVAVALIIGTIELIGVIADQAHITTGPLSAIANIPLDYAGYGIVGLFFGAWVVALAVWKYGHIEEKWSTGLAPTRTTEAAD
jgi:hypothetical protein